MKNIYNFINSINSISIKYIKSIKNINNTKIIEFMHNRASYSIEVNLHVVVHFYLAVLCLISLIETIILDHYPQARFIWVIGVLLSFALIEISLYEPVFKIFKKFVPVIYILIIPVGLYFSGSIITPSVLYSFFALIIVILISSGILRLIYGFSVIIIVSVYILHEIFAQGITGTLFIDKEVYIDWLVFFTTISLILMRLLIAITSYLSQYDDVIRKKNIELYNMSVTDSLTALFNKRFFVENMENIIHNISNNSIALLILDVDYFKKYNDHYGHIVGDECLQKIATVIKRSLYRATDKAYRIGGEEFAIIVENITEQDLKVLINRINKNLADEKIEHIDSLGSKYITVSVGAVIFSNGSYSHMQITQIMQLADKALYESKNRGRDCFTVYNF